MVWCEFLVSCKFLLDYFCQLGLIEFSSSWINFAVHSTLSEDTLFLVQSAAAVTVLAIISNRQKLNRLARQQVGAFEFYGIALANGGAFGFVADAAGRVIACFLFAAAELQVDRTGVDALRDTDARGGAVAVVGD